MGGICPLRMSIEPPYRGIDTFSFLYLRTALEIDTTPIEPLIGGLILQLNCCDMQFFRQLLNPL